MFAAGYAGHHVNGGDLSALGRRPPVGHHYLVGTMFVRFLTERYGEQPLWVAIGAEARALTGWFVTGTFKSGFGVSFGELLDQFAAWCARRFPVRARPAGQRTITALGSDARYARGRDGTEAWVAQDVDLPPRLVVRDPSGARLAELGLVGVVPPRTLVQADPLLVSGLSVTADGREVWLTIIDLGTTYQVPRLLRWRRGESKLTEVSHVLGPGATIDPTGAVYYYCDVDGDRWSLAAWDVRHGTRRTLLDAAPGTYVVGAQISADGRRLVANVWDGGGFVAWVLDAATGVRLAELRGAGTPVWDASFTDDPPRAGRSVPDRRRDATDADHDRAIGAGPDDLQRAGGLELANERTGRRVPEIQGLIPARGDGLAPRVIEANVGDGRGPGAEGSARRRTADRVDHDRGGLGGDCIDDGADIRAAAVSGEAGLEVATDGGGEDEVGMAGPPRAERLSLSFAITHSPVAAEASWPLHFT